MQRLLLPLDCGCEKSAVVHIQRSDGFVQIDLRQLFSIFHVKYPHITVQTRSVELATAYAKSSDGGSDAFVLGSCLPFFATVQLVNLSDVIPDIA
jgi:hypothetical protein